MGLQKRNIKEHFNSIFHSLDKNCMKKKSNSKSWATYLLSINEKLSTALKSAVSYFLYDKHISVY